MTFASLYLSTAGASFEDTCDQVQFAEQAGLRAVWFMDSTTRWAGAPPDVARFDPWSLIPAVATFTNRISLGTLAMPPGRRNPEIAARQIATSDRISDGRVEITLSTGDESVVRDREGQGRLVSGEGIARMIEELEVLRSLWHNERTDYKGEFVEIEDAVCEPKPEFPIPVWMQLGWGPQRLAHEIVKHAYGFTIPLHAVSNELVRIQLARLREACFDSGRSPDELRSSRVVGVTLTEVEVDPDDAKRNLLATADPRTRQLLDSTGPMVHSHLRRYWPDFTPEQYRFEDYFLTNEFHCIGTAEQVADQILAGTHELGIEEAVIWPHGRLHSWQPDCIKTQGDMVERIAKELVPILRRAR